MLGAGSWGTALAKVLRANRHEVTIWGRNPDALKELKEGRN
jgi:glycerol-3-phosphate dehydrogenase (NAD(P)+)